MKNCPVCKTEYGDDYFFCENDGNKLEEISQKTDNLSIGDKNIISGDVHITQSAPNRDLAELGSESKLSIGDKNVISGDISVENTTNIDTVIINKDETNEVLKCAASGRNVRIIETFECNSCHQIFHQEYLDKATSLCSFCTQKDSNLKRSSLKELIVKRLSDKLLDQIEMAEITTFSDSLGYSKEELIKLIAEVRSENQASVGEILSDYENEMIRLCRIHFESFNLAKLYDTIHPIYNKFPNDKEVKFYYFLALGITNYKEFIALKKSMLYDDLEFFKAEYYVAIENQDFHHASQVLAHISNRFPNEVFSKLMQFDLELQTFLNSPFSEDEFMKFEGVLPTLLKNKIDVEKNMLEDSFQRFFQGLYVMLFKMPIKSLFDQQMLTNLKQTTVFGYNRFIMGMFWAQSLKDQNKIYSVLKKAADHPAVLAICELPFLQAINQYRLGSLDELINSKEFRYKSLDPTIRDAFEPAFLDSNKRFVFEKTIPYTNILLNSANGISVPVSMKFKVELTVEDLATAANVFGGNGILNSQLLQRLLEKQMMDIMLSDFSETMEKVNAKIDQISTKCSEFEKAFMELHENKILKQYGFKMNDLTVIRLTPDEESQGYQRAKGAGQPPIMPISSNMYHLNVNGVNYGPYSVQQLAAMIPTSQFSKNTLVWRDGMAQWDCAVNVQELAMMFE